MNVIKEESKKRNAPLWIAPPIKEKIEMGLNGEHQEINASMAIFLTNYIMNEKMESFPNNKTKKGIKETRMLGRGNIYKEENINFYVDGAVNKKTEKSII
jgi:hypothetical protein